MDMILFESDLVVQLANIGVRNTVLRLFQLFHHAIGYMRERHRAEAEGRGIDHTY
jgi:hypothetical protein